MIFFVIAMLFPFSANKKTHARDTPVRRLLKVQPRCLSARRWTNDLAGGRRRSLFSLQAACQVVGAEIAVQNQQEG
jgi:hypothetical protein